MKLRDLSCSYCGESIVLAYEPKQRVVCLRCLEVHDRVVRMVHQRAIAMANEARLSSGDDRANAWTKFDALTEVVDMLRGVK